LVPYASMLDVPYEPVEHVSWLIYVRRRELRFPLAEVELLEGGPASEEAYEES